MKFIPRERIIVETHLTPTEVQQRLDEVIEPKRVFRGFSRDHKPYQGELFNNRFEVTRIIHYRNSFLPVIRGEIQPAAAGSRIAITMQPHVLVYLFMIVWLSFAGGAFLLTLSATATSAVAGESDWLVILAPAAMFLFGYLLVMGGFHFEANKSKAFFQQLWDMNE